VCARVIRILIGEDVGTVEGAVVGAAVGGAGELEEPHAPRTGPAAATAMTNRPRIVPVPRIRLIISTSPTQRPRSAVV
jgi:hypothetical protein